jgi:hypothetical protein
MIIVYSSPQEQAHQLYIWDEDFWYAPDDTWHEFLVRGFRAPSQSEEIEGRITTFVGEGDSNLDGDYIQFKGEDDPDYHYLSDSVNDWDNVWNSRSNTLGFETSEIPGQPSGTISGVDIDTYDVSQWMQPGDTSASVKTGTHYDGWYMVYIILSFRSDIVIESGLYPVRIVTYTHGGP